MRDIPAFTTENGVAGLVLHEIPYRKTAYIVLHSAAEPERLLRECRDFCKAVGAERIYARGCALAEQYPFYTAVIQMERPAAGIPAADASLLPVTEQTLAQWREIYNIRMRNVPLAAYMTEAEGMRLLKKGSGYFVYAQERLLGIGAVRGDWIDGVVSVRPGAGRTVLAALCAALTGQTVRLETADANLPAVRLYEDFGFRKTREIARWYTVL